MNSTSILKRSAIRGISTLGLIVLIVVILLLVGAFPAWPHSTGWGNGPVSMLGVLLIILLVLIVTGRL